MSIEQAIQQYGLLVGLFVWGLAQTIIILVTRWSAGVRADAKARETISALLLKRDEDARIQLDKTSKLEGEIALLRDLLEQERVSSDEKNRLLANRLDEANHHRDELEARLTETETRYQHQLKEANALITDLQQQVERLRVQVTGTEDEKRSLTDRLFEELKQVVRLTAEVEFLRGERNFAERVLSKVQPGVVVPEVTLNPSPV